MGDAFGAGIVAHLSEKELQELDKERQTTNGTNYGNFGSTTTTINDDDL